MLVVAGSFQQAQIQTGSVIPSSLQNNNVRELHEKYPWITASEEVEIKNAFLKMHLFFCTFYASWFLSSSIFCSFLEMLRKCSIGKQILAMLCLQGRLRTKLCLIMNCVLNNNFQWRLIRLIIIFSSWTFENTSTDHLVVSKLAHVEHLTLLYNYKVFSILVSGLSLVGIKLSKQLKVSCTTFILLFVSGNILSKERECDALICLLLFFVCGFFNI